MMGHGDPRRMFFYHLSLETFVPPHPLRAIRPLIDDRAIRRACQDLYAPIGRPSIPRAEKNSRSRIASDGGIRVTSRSRVAGFEAPDAGRLLERVSKVFDGHVVAVNDTTRG